VTELLRFFFIKILLKKELSGIDPESSVNLYITYYFRVIFGKEEE